jgi:hypothetical protein
MLGFLAIMCSLFQEVEYFELKLVKLHKNLSLKIILFFLKFRNGHHKKNHNFLSLNGQFVENVRFLVKKKKKKKSIN